MTPDVTSSSSWDFTPIYNLLDAFKQSEPDRRHADQSHGPSKRPPSPPLRRVRSPSEFDPKVTVPQNLGDFNRLYEFLGLPIQTFPSRPRHESIESSGSASLSDQYHASLTSIQSTPPSSLLDDPNDGTTQYDNFVDIRKVRWTDEVDGSDFADVRRRSRTRRPKTTQKSSFIKNSADFDSETEAEIFRRPPKLVPSLVTPQPTLWVPPSTPKLHIDPMIIQPIDHLTMEEKRTKLIRKLKNTIGFGLEIGMKGKLHIFVDCSNIIIGFYNTLKIRRGYDVKAYTKQAPLSWHSLATILERDRPVARRILVGSNGSPHHEKPSKVPDYILEAENYGYEINLMDRVFKYKDPTPPRKKKGGNGYATTSGHSSGSDGTSMRSRIVTEQGVDELLHMKMLESMVDTHEPSTIVLASGDAAEAEYSGGFFKNVERALEKGWRIELVSWSAGLSREYRSPSFLKRWKDRFTIIELDDFSEELLALYTYAVPPPT